MFDDYSTQIQSDELAAVYGAEIDDGFWEEFYTNAG